MAHREEKSRSLHEKVRLSNQYKCNYQYRIWHVLVLSGSGVDSMADQNGPLAVSWPS